MCGRFVSSSPPDELARYFDVDKVAETVLEQSYNVAPTNDVYVVRRDGALRSLDVFRWGLIPFWAKDIKVGQKMINARADTLATKNAYRRPFAKRRCLIPADGFFEWRATPGQRAKQPMYFQRTDGEPFAFAGLWEIWRPATAAAGGDRGSDAGAADAPDPVYSCTIVTGEPTVLVATVHDRMPVMLPPSAWGQWLDPDFADLDALGKLLVPAPARLMTVHPVSTAVNNVRQKGPELIEAVARTEQQALGDGDEDGP